MTHPRATKDVATVKDPTALLERSSASASSSLRPILPSPFPAAGNSAVVFRASIAGRTCALRFSIRDDASSRGRRTTRRALVDREQLRDTATALWVDAAIRVDGQRRPMVTRGSTVGPEDHCVLTWTHEQMSILAVACRATAPHLSLTGWTSADAGPTT